MKATSIHHIAFTVTNLDRSEAWYRDLFGVEVMLSEHGPVRRALVMRNDAITIGLVQHGRESSTGFDPTVTGLDHAAFTVTSRADLDEWADELTRRGIAYSGPIDVPPGAILNFKDPDGIALSLFWDRDGSPAGRSSG